MKLPLFLGAGRRLADLHAEFLAILPRIELHGRICFRHLPQHRKEDALQEMLALAWFWFLSLQRRNKNPALFMKTFTTLLARAVNSGRRLVGQEKAKDVMNAATQRRRGFQVETLPAFHRTSHEQLYGIPNGQELHDAFEERLRDNTTTPVPEQVQFRIDWPSWLATLTPRERRIIRAMARSESTKDISRQFELSPARISQLRREFHEEWTKFCDAAEPAVGPG